MVGSDGGGGMVINFICVFWGVVVSGLMGLLDMVVKCGGIG